MTIQPNDRLDFAREAIGLGRVDLAMDISSMRTLEFSIDYPAEERSVRAVLAEADGRRADALTAFQDAGAWGDLGNPYEAAMAALGEGRCLVGLDRGAEATPVLRQAREIFEQLGAAPALAETDALLMETTALGAG